MTTICDLPSTASIIIGTILTIGILLSYIPQLHLVIKNKSVKGINYTTIILANIGSVCNLLGVIFIMYDSFSCCENVSANHCAQILLPMIQMTSPWIAQITLLMLFISWNSRRELSRYYRITLMIYLLLTILFITIGIIIAKCYNKYNVAYGNVLDTISSILSCLIYIPQLIHTYRIKTSGNFSLLMLGIQMPGAFAIFIYQSFMGHTSVSTGIPYLISGIQQLVLLIMCIYYDYYSSYNRYNRIQ